MKRKRGRPKKSVAKKPATLENTGESDDGLQFGGASSDSDEPHIDRRVNKKANKRGRPKKLEASKKTANATANYSKGLGSSSRKELSPMKHPAQDSRLNKKELKASLAVIKKVMEMDEAVPFSAPVDPVSQGLPDYFSVIDTPMDFGTICSDLQNRVKYLNSEDVYKAVQYIWENCRKYNKKGDYIVYLMKRVKKKFMKYWTAAGLCSEIMKKPSGHSQLKPSGDCAVRYSRHDPMSTVNRLVSNTIQMQENNFGGSQPQLPPSNYTQPYHYHQPQSSNNQVPQFSRYQAGADSIYAGHSHRGGPPSTVLPMEREKQIPKQPVVSMANGSTHSQPQQPQLSSYYLWPPQQSTGQPHPSQSHIGADFSNAGQMPFPPTDCAMTQNGFPSRSSVDPMFSMNQPQHHLHSQRPSESHQPRASIGHPQPSQPLPIVDISSAGMQHSDARRMARRHMHRHSAAPEAEIPLTSDHLLPQLPSGSHNPQFRSQRSTHESKRRVRGPTRCRFMLDMPDGERIFVPINELGQPVGAEASKLASFLGTVARNGNMAPLNFLDWSAMPETSKEDMWQFVQSKFDLDPLCKTWVMKSLASKWRNWKAKLKADHYNPHSTDEERLKDCNKRILPDQWAALVAHWNSEEVQLRCAKNKANRAKQKTAHAAGSKSFARIREEERAKRSDGKEPTRGELYILTRTRKDGQPVDKGAAEVISKLREQATQKQQTSNDSSEYADTYCQVMGEDRRGDARMYGLGPTPTELWGRKPSHSTFMKMVLEAKRSANEEVSKMLNKMEAMEQKYASLEDQIARMTSNMQILIDKMDALGSKQVLDNALEDAPQGRVHSSSSSHPVRFN
ncbi:uncharacterized protein LOC105629656 isoform X2 [Jatropha curcas]|uniref:uncharacterized protein LOC105629656 isoform X2 n=1 Tax=Jatropha curcas TaxID=180498 RepID=UPI0009D682C1|nr:uncharacterized protein LOC105629656 isoform X2 [Jatropha curcas]XP_020533281.1 uncharacterized protein LOC105629656 isoform X2 [Jatropha curcas]